MNSLEMLAKRVERMARDSDKSLAEVRDRGIEIAKQELPDMNPGTLFVAMHCASYNGINSR